MVCSLNSTVVPSLQAWCGTALTWIFLSIVLPLFILALGTYIIFTVDAWRSREGKASQSDRQSCLLVILTTHPIKDFTGTSCTGSVSIHKTSLSGEDGSYLNLELDFGMSQLKPLDSLPPGVRVLFPRGSDAEIYFFARAVLIV